MQPNSILSRTNRMRLLFIMIIICVLIAGIIIYQALRFHIVSTTPSMDNFPDNSPILIINFSKPLAKTTLTTSWSPGVNSTYDISGADLTIAIHSALTTGKSYTITIS